MTDQREKREALEIRVNLELMVPPEHQELLVPLVRKESRDLPELWDLKESQDPQVI